MNVILYVLLPEHHPLASNIHTEVKVPHDDDDQQQSRIGPKHSITKKMLLIIHVSYEERLDTILHTWARNTDFYDVQFFFHEQHLKSFRRTKPKLPTLFTYTSDWPHWMRTLACFHALGDLKHQYDFVFKLDDDSFVNIPNLVAAFAHKSGTDNIIVSRTCWERYRGHDFHRAPWPELRPIVEPRSWYWTSVLRSQGGALTKIEYPAGGAGYVLSRQVWRVFTVQNIWDKCIVPNRLVTQRRSSDFKRLNVTAGLEAIIPYFNDTQKSVVDPQRPTYSFHMQEDMFIGFCAKLVGTTLVYDPRFHQWHSAKDSNFITVHYVKTKADQEERQQRYNQKYFGDND